MGFPTSSNGELDTSLEHMRCVMKFALGKYALQQLKIFYPPAYAKRIADIFHKNNQNDREYAVLACRMEAEANTLDLNPDEHARLLVEVDTILLENVDMSGWLQILKTEWYKFQTLFPEPKREIYRSYIYELSGLRNNQSHERPEPNDRFADTGALLLEAIQAEETIEMRTIASRLSGGHHSGNGLNGGGRSNGHSASRPLIFDEPDSSPLIEEDEPDESTERVIPVSPDGNHFIVITTPSGEAAQFWIPKDKHRLIIGRGVNSDLSINDKRVSRAHARVTYHPEIGYTITDLCSANGTSLNKEPLIHSTPMMWVVGGVVVIGDTTLILRRGFV